MIKYLLSNTILLMVSTSCFGELAAMTDEELSSHFGRNAEAALSPTEVLVDAGINEPELAATLGLISTNSDLNPYLRKGGITIELAFSLTIGHFRYKDASGVANP